MSRLVLQKENIFKDFNFKGNTYFAVELKLEIEISKKLEDFLDLKLKVLIGNSTNENLTTFSYFSAL